MKLALCLVIAAAGCATEAVPVAPSADAPGMKRVTQDVSPPSYGRPRRVLRDRANRSEQRAPLHDWTGVAACESSGHWDDNTGNGYYGGLQMDLTFWTNYGGLRYAHRPDLASELEQITIAERGLAVQGIGSWPICGRFIRTAA